jgi:tetratricopeptide (TPR) repeat protein
MRFYLILLSVLLTATAQGRQLQQPVQGAVPKAKESSTDLVNQLLQLADKQETLSEGLRCLDSAERVAVNASLPAKAAEAVWKKGTFYLKEYEDSAAEQQFMRAGTMYEAISDQKGMAVSYRGRARVLQLRGFYTPAIGFDTKAKALFETLQETDEIARTCNDIGVCYYLQGDYPQAINYYLAALKLYQQTKNLGRQVLTEGNIARVYHKTKELEKARVIIEKTFEVYRSLGDSNGLAQAYIQMGVNHDLRLRGDSALRWYEKANIIFERKGNLSGKAQCMTNMAIVHSDSGRYSEAHALYQSALQLFKKIGNESNILTTQLNLAELYQAAPDSFFRNQGWTPASRLERARQLYLDNIERAKAGGDGEVEQLAWAGLSQLYQTAGDYQKAYEARIQSDRLKDQLVDEEKIGEIAQQVSKYEYEKQEAVLLAKQEVALGQKQRERNAILIGAAVLLLAGLYSFFVYRKKRNAEALQKEAELQREITEIEMKALRAQMNPHFMFNSLNAIGDFISRSETKLANEYLASFAKLMRLVLENSEKKLVCLADDLKALELYMKLEALRSHQKFDYTIQVDPSLDPENTYVPPLLLQPFVENSIWHGIVPKASKGHIQVRIEKEGAQIRCVVEDDGVGRRQSAQFKSPTEAKDRKSLGVQITAARVELLNKTRQAAAGMLMTDLEKGTRVEVLLPLETD